MDHNNNDYLRIMCSVGWRRGLPISFFMTEANAFL